MVFIAHLLFVVLSGYGMAVIFVEKKRQWPIRRYNLLLKKLFKKVHPRLPKMLNCTVCTSFWTSLVAEVLIFVVSLAFGYQLFWTWPLSGFITAGMTWTIMDFLISIATLAEK